MFYLLIFDSMEDTLELTKITVLCFTWRTSEQVGRLQTKVDLLLQVEIVLQRRLVQTAPAARRASAADGSGRVPGERAGVGGRQ